MLLSQHYLRDGAVRLRNLETQIKEGSDSETLRNRVYGLMIDMIFAAEEIHFCTGDFEYKEMKDALIATLKSYSETEDVSEMKSILAGLLSRFFPEGRDYASMTLSDFRHSVNKAITSIDNLSEQNINAVASCINMPDRTVNILDPRCRRGDNLQMLKSSLTGSVAYGIEQEPNIADTAKLKLDRVAKGSFSGSRISNEVFDVMFTELPISWMMQTATTIFAKQEKTFMNNILKYARYGSVIAIVVPYFRMYKDVATLLARHLDDIQIRRLSDKDFYDKGLVIITGTRSNKKMANEADYHDLRRLYNIDVVKGIFDTPMETYTLPSGFTPVEFFRGSVLDFDEMEKIAEASGCMEAFWSAQDVEKLSEHAKQPLLPFNIGQIGLVLTSGCLDGVVDEGDGHYHVIKGRVSKKTSTERSTSSGHIEVNETISNRVEINIFMPNGEYKVLA